jgi:hypothetical protein
LICLFYATLGDIRLPIRVYRRHPQSAALFERRFEMAGKYVSNRFAPLGNDVETIDRVATAAEYVGIDPMALGVKGLTALDQTEVRFVTYWWRQDRGNHIGRFAAKTEPKYGAGAATAMVKWAKDHSMAYILVVGPKAPVAMGHVGATYVSLGLDELQAAILTVDKNPDGALDI